MKDLATAGRREDLAAYRAENMKDNCGGDHPGNICGVKVSDSQLSMQRSFMLWPRNTGSEKYSSV